MVGLPATEIASQVLKNMLTSVEKVKHKIDEVIMGNVLAAGLGQNPARLMAVKAGLKDKVPAMTVNKVCGSGLKAVILAAQAIQLGEADLVIAGGMENMSRAPYLLDNYRFGAKLGHQTLKDSMISDGLWCNLIDEHMGITAENVARKFRISRKEQDKFAMKSHQKAIRAIDQQKFKEEIVPMTLADGSQWATDEQPRRDTSLKKLAELRTVFKPDGTVTAGNASSINDGASMVLVASDAAVKRYKLKPLAVIKDYAAVGLDPAYMGLGSCYAAKKCLKRAGLKIKDINLWEINEAFASQSLAVIKLLGVNHRKVNVNGGAIALGHPIGASGARILTTLVYELKRRKLMYGVASLCIGGGQGVAMVIENVSR